MVVWVIFSALNPEGGESDVAKSHEKREREEGKLRILQFDKLPFYDDDSNLFSLIFPSLNFILNEFITLTTVSSCFWYGN